MCTPTKKGSITEAVVLAALVKAGKKVVIPYGNYGEYDLLIDEGTRFVKVQCKTGKLTDGVVNFRAYTHNSLGDKSYSDQIDWFGVFCPQNQKTYLVPASKCNMGTVSLRVDPPKNNWKKRIVWASQFEVS